MEQVELFVSTLIGLVVGTLLGLYFLQLAMVCAIMAIDGDEFFKSKKEFIAALSPLYVYRFALDSYRRLK